ncbi:MAG TPA: SDR family oxidoreductase [Ilumatobacteraceae bacterium]|nr:SDR family oxidoreductase [Ilumatobacteraceae bacterium]
MTGASGGIGRAVCAELVRLGMHVHALALADAALDQLHDLDGVTTHGVDVRDTEVLAAALSGLDVDVLVNNAGTIGDLQPTQSSNTAVADALIDINLRAAVHSTMAVLPGMVQRNSGHVVFTGSIAGTRPTANSAIYSATKAALNAFADGLRMDLHGTAVRITVLAPGRVETNLYDAALGGHDAAVDRLYSGATSLQPADVAAVVGMAVTMPAHVDVTRIEVVPTGQIFGGSTIAGMD